MVIISLFLGLIEAQDVLHFFKSHAKLVSKEFLQLQMRQANEGKVDLDTFKKIWEAVQAELPDGMTIATDASTGEFVHMASLIRGLWDISQVGGNRNISLEEFGNILRALRLSEPLIAQRRSEINEECSGKIDYPTYKAFMMERAICSICLGIIKGRDDALPCGHHFCHECIKKAIVRKKIERAIVSAANERALGQMEELPSVSCPNCRAQVIEAYLERYPIRLSREKLLELFNTFDKYPNQSASMFEIRRFFFEFAPVEYYEYVNRQLIAANKGSFRIQGIVDFNLFVEMYDAVTSHLEFLLHFQIEHNEHGFQHFARHTREAFLACAQDKYCRVSGIELFQQLVIRGLAQEVHEGPVLPPERVGSIEVREFRFLGSVYAVLSNGLHNGRGGYDYDQFRKLIYRGFVQDGTARRQRSLNDHDLRGIFNQLEEELGDEEGMFFGFHYFMRISNDYQLYFFFSCLPDMVMTEQVSDHFFRYARGVSAEFLYAQMDQIVEHKINFQLFKNIYTAVDAKADYIVEPNFGPWETFTQSEYEDIFSEVFPKDEATHGIGLDRLTAATMGRGQCSICLAIITCRDARLSCGHHFCHECIKNVVLFNTTPSCPNCRTPLIEADLKRYPIRLSRENLLELFNTFDHDLNQSASMLEIRRFFLECVRAEHYQYIDRQMMDATGGSVRAEDPVCFDLFVAMYEAMISRPDILNDFHVARDEHGFQHFARRTREAFQACAQDEDGRVSEIELFEQMVIKGLAEEVPTENPAIRPEGFEEAEVRKFRFFGIVYDNLLGERMTYADFKLRICRSYMPDNMERRLRSLDDDLQHLFSTFDQDQDGMFFILVLLYFD